MPEPVDVPKNCPVCGYEGVCFTISADSETPCEVHCQSIHDPAIAVLCNWSEPVQASADGVYSIRIPYEEIKWTPGF